MGREMVLSRTAIRSLLKKQNNEQLIFEVLTKLRSSCPTNFNEKIETFQEMKDLTSSGFKRSQQEMGMESPCLPGKRAKFNTEHEENLINIETQSLKLTQYDSTPNTESKENNNLIDMLADKFGFWKEGEEELEKKGVFSEEKENVNSGNSNALFNVDDFFS